MIYELRRYEALPGRIDQLHELMETLNLPTFERIGINVVGCWTPDVGDDENALIYLIAHDDLAARERSWQRFASDQEWKNARELLAKKFGGPIVGKSVSTLLKPTNYSRPLVT